MKTLIATILVFILLIVVYAAAVIEGGKDFRENCTELGGKPLHDGRQWQCLDIQK